MWKRFQERELGVAFPCSYAAAVRRLRVGSISLSEDKDCICSARSAINSLQIDPVEARYLLAGSGNGSIAAFDVVQPSTVESSSQRHEPLFCVGKETPQGHAYSVSSVHWYPVDTGIFVSGSFDENVNVWDANTLEVLLQFKLAKVHSVSMSPVATTHMLIAAGTEDFRVRLCDIGSGAFTHTLTGHRDGVWAVKWSASCEYILITGGCDGSIRLWDIRRAGCFFVLDQHRTLASLKYASGGKVDAKDPQAPRTHPGLATNFDKSTAHYGAVTALETSRDGHYLLSAGTDSRVRLWDLATGCNTLVNYEATRINRQKTCQLTVSSDGPLVFVPCSSSVHSYDMLSGRFVSTLKGHYELVNCCCYNPHTQELYSGSNDRRILVWEANFPKRHVEDEKYSNLKSAGQISLPKQNSVVRADEDYWSD